MSRPPTEVVNALRDRARILNARPFPAGDIEVEGILLPLLHADASGSINCFVGRGPNDPRAGTLDSGHTEILRKCVSELSRVVPTLEGEMAADFAELHDLATAVLGHVDP